MEQLLAVTWGGGNEYVDHTLGLAIEVARAVRRVAKDMSADHHRRGKVWGKESAHRCHQREAHLERLRDTEVDGGCTVAWGLPGLPNVSCQNH